MQKHWNITKRFVSASMLAFYVFVTCTANFFHSCSHGDELQHKTFIHNILENGNHICSHDDSSVYRTTKKQWNHNTDVCLTCVFLTSKQIENIYHPLIAYEFQLQEYPLWGQTTIPHEYILSDIQTRAPPFVA